MSKIDERKGVKIIQKGILGHLGHLFSTYAGIQEYINNKQEVEGYICKESKKSVPSVPKTTEVSISGRRPYWQRADGSCCACNGTESWLSIHGVTICGRCHPPANDRLVALWGNA